MNILVTGGVSGLGKAISVKLALEYPDSTVYASYFSSSTAAQFLESSHANIKTIHCDFSSQESVDALIALLPEMNLGLVVNNALTGIESKHFHKIDANFFVDSFVKNVMPVIKLSQALIPLFRKQKEGKFITILSSYILQAPPLGMSEYVAAKCYLQSISNSLAAENAKYGITANCLSPTIMRTGLTSDTDERVFEELEKASPLKRLLTVEETADAVYYLSRKGVEVNGQNFKVDAGDIFV